ncbi:hypothetical protein DFH08DRAFT_804390 [Mycena albidolilacea]|uniref:Uncharacterized protein n=1 Tax=Mycena albidolilacea TaxID=1033008 RepID=A0AAD7ABY9_9AGAR|nr:hypothetical protein DFH08DRAFT_804390 [Mycena albidolilacea]
MANTRSSHTAATVPAANTRSGRRIAASRLPTRNVRVKPPSQKKLSTKKTTPEKVPAPTEVLEAVPTDDEPEGNKNVIDTASNEIVATVEDNEKGFLSVIDTAPAKAPKAVPGDDEQEYDEETIDSDVGGGDGSRPQPSHANSPLPASSPPPALSSPLVSSTRSPIPPSAPPPVPTRPLPCRKSPRSTTVPWPATGDVNDNMFSLTHRRVPRRTASSEPQLSSDNLWESVGSEPKLNSDNLDEVGVGRQGQRGQLDNGDCTDIEDEGGEDAFADYTSFNYDEPDNMGKVFAHCGRYTSPTNPRLPPSSSSSYASPTSPRPPPSASSRSHQTTILPTPTTIAPAPDSPRCSPPRTRSGGIQARPLPERSPSHSQDLSSDDSTEEYRRTQEAKRRLKAARVAHRHSPAAASTADDEEDLQNYLVEVGTHGFGEKDAKGEKSTTKKSKRKSKVKAGTATDGKGKGRAAPPVPVSDPEPTDPNPDEVMEEDLMERGYAPGPGEYDVKVAALALLCNKDPATLCRTITPHELHNTLAWNMYLAHHALHHPKRPDVSVTQYNIDARTVFEALLPGLSKAEMGKTPLVLEHLPWLQSWLKKLNTNHIENLRAKGQYKAQAKKAVKPLIQIAKQLSNTWGIHIFAVTIDPHDRESFAFGGSCEMEQVRRGDDSSIIGFVRDLETKIRFGKIMGNCLSLLTAEQVQTATMVWNEKFLDLAFRGKFRLINYPIALENIGQVIGAEQFNTKAPNVKEYNSFMPVLERTAEQGTTEDPEGKPVIRIVAWDPAERSRELDELGEVPLVMSTDRRCLWSVQHSPAYGAALAETADQTTKRQALRRAEKRKADSSVTSSVTFRQCPIPIPQGGSWRYRTTPSFPHHAHPDRYGIATGRESALAHRLQPSPVVDTPDVRPAKCHRTDNNGRDTVAQTHVGSCKRKHSPASPGDRDAEKPPIAMQLAINDQQSELFYATKFQPVPRTRLQDRHTYYFNTDEKKWRPIPEGMEPVLLSREDLEKCLKAKIVLDLFE